ncbi:SDR family NAD(P)-dependent oxidoreductase [Micromonospora sp. NPDC049048]|uniref:SDR family NAD(P)-dependent oxidoreductase n=1 Tax=Micromonospora sp. NPDC049048 TaxID=3364263 RepID=UPI00371E3EEC
MTRNVDSTHPFGLAGRVAVVTGAARGIGRAAAVALAAAGADVVGIDIVAEVSPRMDYSPAVPADLAETGRAVREHDSGWLAIEADIRDMKAMRTAAKTAADRWGGVDIVFANAGIQAFKPLLEMDDDDWHEHIDTNLNGTANTLRAFAPYLVERGGGRLIVTSSTQGQHGTLWGASYAASKWGILGLMKSAALELGQYGITVNAIVPGLIDTALTRHEDRYAQAIADGGNTPTGDEAKDEKTAAAALAGKLPLRVPWIEPADVAPAVVYLASDAARMVSGATLSVTGGDSARFTP